MLEYIRSTQIFGLQLGKKFKRLLLLTLMNEVDDPKYQFCSKTRSRVRDRVLAIAADYGTEVRTLGDRYGCAQLETAREILSPLVDGLESRMKIPKHNKMQVIVEPQVCKQRPVEDYTRLHTFRYRNLKGLGNGSHVEQRRSRLGQAMNISPPKDFEHLYHASFDDETGDFKVSTIRLVVFKACVGASLFLHTEAGKHGRCYDCISCPIVLRPSMRC
jgi:hypothetical protein